MNFFLKNNPKKKALGVTYKKRELCEIRKKKYIYKTNQSLPRNKNFKKEEVKKKNNTRLSQFRNTEAIEARVHLRTETLGA